MEGVSYSSALYFGYQTQPWDSNTETLAINGIFFFSPESFPVTHF